nr:MAG TPA: hypothetical protein [Caudoviricetes sp.]
MFAFKFNLSFLRFAQSDVPPYTLCSCRSQVAPKK